jgi:hypothetical protein
MPTTYLRCPNCTGMDVEPSRLGRWDSILHFLAFGLVRPYRCIRCWNRFWQSNKYGEQPTSGRTR